MSYYFIIYVISWTIVSLNLVSFVLGPTVWCFNSISNGDDGAQRQMQKIYMTSLCSAVMQPLFILNYMP